MNSQFVAQQMTAFRGLDWIDVADDVGYGHIRCRELFDESGVSTDPIDRRSSPCMSRVCLPKAEIGLERIVVDFGARR